ncbi:hypothetical protein CVV68_05805 [Arthrobacter livingstonensis]|uniref:Ribbon-helix-helix protein CopG domain-containing protein n=1 Tax=Arthrobacter livingstonensis TaxID=670078 RepID=A0A2V5LY59_9MICC|nr:hypothetical protein [Arthrobacter livingstonensis]PYI68797.1 hypothetical protein CVV68_05805 [Arthrobacter livingstonensis]
MAKKEAAALTAKDQTRYQIMADWAESAMAPVAVRGTALYGEDAAAHARGMLADAGMDPAELDRLIGGRPNLDPDAKPGKHSPQLNLRVTPELKQQISDLAHERGTKPSELARELLTAGVRELQRSHQGTTHGKTHTA